ncbi:hypothetical protein HYQ46_004525 [Verticillium longisporum]|nr:hypothetical protein HYQ46_004525 [Verticillium longisporum]
MKADANVVCRQWLPVGYAVVAVLRVLVDGGSGDIEGEVAAASETLEEAGGRDARRRRDAAALLRLRRRAGRRTVAVLPTEPATAPATAVVVTLNGSLPLAKVLEPRIVLKLNELLIVEASVVNRHVKVITLGAGGAAEAEIATSKVLVLAVFLHG